MQGGDLKQGFQGSWQRPEESEKLSHVSMEGKNFPGIGHRKVKGLRVSGV